MAKQDDYVRYTIRVPAPLYARLQEAAGEKSINAEIIARLQESFEKTPSDFNALQIVLNTDGLPIGWDEIFEHLRAINRAGKFSFNSQEVHVITPDLLSRMGREEEAERLAKSYKRMERSLTKKPKPSDTEGQGKRGISSAVKRQLDLDDED